MSKFEAPGRPVRKAYLETRPAMSLVAWRAGIAIYNLASQERTAQDLTTVTTGNSIPSFY